MKRTIFSLLLVLILFGACTSNLSDTKVTSDPLPSWIEGEMKSKIVNFVINEVPNIPAEDRLAVFDMDGTIACEEPLWLEMYAAVKGLNDQSKEDPSLLEQIEYQYAAKLAVNPFDTSVSNNWGVYIDSMIWKAYVGIDNEVYIDTARAYLTRTKSMDPRFDSIALADMFYPPMLELLQYLADNEFSIYIVSGSLQGLIWSVCPQKIEFERGHMIGTLQLNSVVYQPSKEKAEFILEKGIYKPKNNKDGKSQNIYTRIGKTPVFAFGNTTGDFGMFHLTSTNSLPNISFLLNHNDADREYSYEPWHGESMPTWRDTMAVNGWNIVDMKENFKVVF